MVEEGGSQEEEAEAEGNELCPRVSPRAPFSPDISCWELRPVSGEDGVSGPGLCPV